MIWKLLKFTAFVALAAACFVVSVKLNVANAATVTVRIAIQPPAYVATLCDPEPWGCVTWIPARNNPLDLWCVVHVRNNVEAPWENDQLAVLLRPRCDAPALSRGAGL